jgi:hypothetical protein
MEAEAASNRHCSGGAETMTGTNINNADDTLANLPLSGVAIVGREVVETEYCHLYTWRL